MLSSDPFTDRRNTFTLVLLCICTLVFLQAEIALENDMPLNTFPSYTHTHARTSAHTREETTWEMYALMGG
jgi:hypothetical protein